MHPVGSPSTSFSTLTETLARLAQRFDLRARPANAVPDANETVSRAFRCDLPRLDCIAALREAWARLSFAALGQEQAGGGLLPVAVGDVPGVARVTRAALGPAPLSALCGRRATLAALARQAGAPGVWAVASGALIDDTVPPGTVRMLLMATLEAAWGDGDSGEQADGAEPMQVARTPVAVAAFDVAETPHGSHGRVRALAVCQPWVEVLAHEAFGTVWQWVDAEVEAAATKATKDAADAGQAASPGDRERDQERERTERLRALQASYLGLCRLYRDRGEPRRPRLADFADNQGLSVATLKRLLHDLGVDWRRDFATLPLNAGESELI